MEPRKVAVNFSCQCDFGMYRYLFENLVEIFWEPQDTRVDI